MSNDTSDTHAARSTDTKTFRPFVDDRMRRHVRRDHAPNAALHATLRALSESDASRVANVNLMASHGPGEKDHEPDYDVVVDIENAGGGSAATYGTIVRKLVQYGDVVITDAEATSIPPESDAHPGDTDYAVDRLTLHLRPVETVVEPIEIEYRDLPSDVYDFDTVRRNAEMVLDHAIETQGSNPETYEAARCFATFLYLIDPETEDRSFDPEDDSALRWIRHLTDATQAEWELPDVDEDEYGFVTYPPNGRREFHSVTFRHDDGSTGEVTLGTIDDAADAVEAARAILDTFDVDHPVEPTGYATGDGGVVACGGEPDATNRTGADRDGAHATLGPLTATGLFGELLAELDTLKHDLREDGRDTLAKRVDELAGRYASRADDTPDRDTITTSGRVDAPPTPTATTSLNVLSAAELGSCVVEGGWSVECPAKTSDACTFNYATHDLDDYHIGMLVAYPECEACGATLDLVPPEGDGRTLADATASGLGLAALAEVVARKDSKDSAEGVPPADVDVDDAAIGRALSKGVIGITGDGRLVDRRDELRDELEGGSDE